MMSNKLFSFLFIFISLHFAFNLSLAQTPDTVGVVDTLRVGKVTAYPGSEVCVPVYAFNDEDLGAITVPLKFSSSDLFCDSVSFVGTRISDELLKGGEIDNVNRTIKIYDISTTQISSGNGLIANMWFKIDNNALPQTVEIDTFSTTEPPLSLAFVYTWAEEMIPAFVKGEITINEKNLPPQIQPVGTQYVNEGDTLLIEISANDPEGDSIKFSLLSGPEGASFTDSSNGKAIFLWVPPYSGPWSSVNSPFKVTFIASDGNNTSKEDVEINVIDKNPSSKAYVLEIGADTGLYSDLVTIPIKLTNPDSIGAMKLLLNFDHTALSLLNVSKLNTRIDNWEYFQYRLNQPEVGDVLILGVADIPNTTLTLPLPPGSGVIANLNFQIILNPCPTSLSTFLRFIFTDSTDNTLSSALSQELIGQNDIEYKDGYVLIQCPDDVTDREENISAIPKTYELSQNYPNPFNPVTEISFALPQESEVNLTIYNIKGQIVNKLVNERLKPGRYKVRWEGTDSAGNRVASGIYFYRINAGKYSETKKMIMVN
jgi:hypothetical protein